LETKKYYQAIPLYEKALSLAKNDDNFGIIMYNLGLLYQDSNRYEADSAFSRALKIREKIAKQNPRAFEIELCETLINLGIFQFVLLGKEPKQAYKTKGVFFFERAISILSKYPDVPQAQEYMKRAIKLKQKLENAPVK